MRIGPRHISSSSKVAGGIKAKSTQFRALVDMTDDDMRDLVSNSELKEVFQELARDAHSGASTKEDLGQRFVDAVIESRFKGVLGKKAAEVKSQVTQVVVDDQQFMTRLFTQLQRLGREENTPA